MFKEFRDFINRGNVIDLAVAFILGAAFNPIVKSFVNNIIMPPIGLLLGRVDFSNLGFILRDADQYGSVREALDAGAPVIAYGVFLNTIISFLITAFAIFLLLRSYNNMKKRLEQEKVEAPAKPPAPPRQEVLLEEIRDLLAKQG